MVKKSKMTLLETFSMLILLTIPVLSHALTTSYPIIVPDHCHVTPQYIVLESQHQPNDILIKYRLNPNDKVNCQFHFEKGDFLIREQEDDAQYFLGLQGDFLLLDHGTGPDRSFTVWNLKKRVEVFSSDYSDPTKPGLNSFTFWKETSEGNVNNCPDYKKITSDSLTPIVETQVTLDLSTMKIIKSNNVRCVAHQ